MPYIDKVEQIPPTALVFVNKTLLKQLSSRKEQMRDHFFMVFRVGRLGLR